MTADDEGSVREPFRPLTGRECQIVHMLLSVEVPGIEELRSQVPHATVARWDCGCASFDVRVDRQRAPRSEITTSPLIDATTVERDDYRNTFDLLLWIKDGWLSGSRSSTTSASMATSHPTRSLRLSPGISPASRKGVKDLAWASVWD